ncbi:MAG: hypothetical protein LJE92_18145 [Gammaproteobacteria bacterium]|jgi:hypothetical protein|nr:hypothetical protein [Gammaproteobacteria bacterium]
MRLGIYLALIGVGLVGLIIGLFWLKDRLESLRLARIAHSEPIARLAVIGAALTVIGLLLIVSSQFQS